MKTKIAVVCVNYNGWQDSEEFLLSRKILKTAKWDMRWVMVDNGSTRPGLGEIASKFSEVVWLQTGLNTGFTGGYNRGVRYALADGAEYILVINNDTLFTDPGLIKEMVGVMEEDGRVGIVCPKIMFAPGYEYHKERYSQNQAGKVIWYGGGWFDWRNIVSVHRGIDEVDTGEYNVVAETDSVTGCCMLVRRQVFEQAGLFDEKLFAYFEDNDLLVRAHRAGWKSVYCGVTQIAHKVSRTAGIGSQAADYYITRNRIYFALQYASWRTRLAVVREAVRLLILGREQQRRGVIDFLTGKWGKMGQSVEYFGEWPVKLSVAVVNYKTAQLVEELLRSVYRRNSGIAVKDLEVVVLDNASEDDVAARVAKFSQVKYIANSVNTGFAGGYNKAMDGCRGEYVLMLNSDIEVKPEALGEMTAAADRLGGGAVVAGKLIFPDRTIQNSCYHLPSVWGAFKEYFLGREGSYFMFRPRGGELSLIPGAVMACMLIPRRIISRVGRLSEASFMYFEDVEYCRRLKSAGVPIYYCPRAEFIHHHGAASKVIGFPLAMEYSVKGSKFYHGAIKYAILWAVLWLGQKWGKVKTPVSRWQKD